MTALRRLAPLLLFVAACAAAEEERDDAAERARAESGPELSATTLALHEVAFLYPLPAKDDAGLIAASRDLGDGRALLPLVVTKRLGSIVAGEPNELTHASLRVVGVRLEPCFRAARDAACTRQIRFVLQPVSVDPSGVLPTTTLDAAVHVIYDLPREAFAELVKAIVAARPADVASAPLDVHPVLAKEGLAGPYARAIEDAFVGAAKRGDLSRVTFLGLRGRGNEWQLGGVDVARDGSTKPLTIPASDARIQSFVLQRGTESFSKSVVPAVDADLALLFDSGKATAASRDDVARALHVANQIENPTLRSSEDTGCAACHTVASSRLWAESTLGVRDDRDRFVSSSFDLTARSRPLGDPSALRALGYFGSDPVVSPRAIHDTALAARWIAGDRNTP